MKSLRSFSGHPVIITRWSKVAVSINNIFFQGKVVIGLTGSGMVIFIRPLPKLIDVIVWFNDFHYFTVIVLSS